MTLRPTYEELERRLEEVATGAVEPNRVESGEGESKESFLAKKSVAFIAGILILFGLYLSSFYNYLLFHSLAEIFSIVVACGIFIVAWNSRRIMDNNYLLFLGIAYLFIGILDLIHTLGYTGMEIFQGYGTNLPAQLWIASRYMESLSLLIAPLFLARRLRVDLVLMLYALVTILVLGSVFYWHIFPTCFVEGVGLTPFKKISEYIISIILLGAITLLFQKRKEFNERVFRLLVAAMIATIAAELAFTFYISAYGFSNLVGHYFKITSFYLIYKAIIETGLTKPYNLLFRHLKQSEDALRESEGKYRGLVEGLDEAIYRMSLPDGKYEYMSPAARKVFGYSAEEFIENPLIIGKLMHPDFAEYFDEKWADLIEGKVPPTYKYKILDPEGNERWIVQSNTGIFDDSGNIIAIEGLSRDITKGVRAEEVVRESEELHKEAQRVAHIGHWELYPEIGTPVWSDEIFRIFGLNPQEKEPSFTDHETHLHPDDWPLLNKAVTLCPFGKPE